MESLTYLSKYNKIYKNKLGGKEMEDLVVKFNEFTKKKYYPTYSIRQKFFEDTKNFEPHYRLEINLYENTIAECLIMIGVIYIPIDAEKPILKLEWVVDNDMDTIKKQATFMEKKLMTILLRLPDPEDEQVEEEEAQRIQEIEQKSEELDKYERARKGIWVIFKKAGIEDDNERHNILEKITGCKHINELNSKQINEFYHEIANMLGMEKIESIPKLTENDFKEIQSYFYDILGGE